jgi:hypothetical protein
MFNNISATWNNNSLVGPHDSKHKKKEEQLSKEFKSFKDIMKVDEEESMIYGCE